LAWLDEQDGFERINALGKSHTPFLFIVSYDKKKIFAQPLEHLDDNIFYKLEKARNYPVEPNHNTFAFSKNPIDFPTYKKAFDHVIDEIKSGNTYLLNLTFKTPITSSLSLKEIFTFARAKFKLYYKDEFICFSPEPFISIDHNTISTYPMKGTIDASIPDAKSRILSNPKEMAEHTMIVDLMRNDLSIIAKHVKVEKFRYVDKILAGEKELLQVSSKIIGQIEESWHENIGSILQQLLPAGSITGTPKRSTQNIINASENFERDFYTGVFGIFDGNTLQSAVMIRFIEQKNQQLFYKSGGGITIDSDAQDEYQELIDKIYLPIYQ